MDNWNLWETKSDKRQSQKIENLKIQNLFIEKHNINAY